jgi:shikimate kinase
MNPDKLAAELDRSIVLVGLMGAGKSAVGRRLAARLGLKFVDADAEIEKAAGCSIADIFEIHGESAFREGERRVVARLLKEPPHVLATGGGAFMDAETRERIRERGISVWLRADIELLLSRVSRRDDRPLLKQGDKREILDQLIKERHPVYAEADITVDSEDVPHDRMVDKIIAALNAHLRGRVPQAHGSTP